MCTENKEKKVDMELEATMSDTYLTIKSILRIMKTNKDTAFQSVLGTGLCPVSKTRTNWTG
ncbi:7536_t:CDS:2, partial [Funneliformis caledonium]